MMEYRPPTRNVKLKIGDIVEMKKSHPCGGKHWRVQRLGIDVGMECLTCGRKVKARREKIERNIKKVLGKDESK